MAKQNKYQREIEKLLQASERNVSKELYQMYKDLADDISKEIIALQKEIDETDKFSKKLQKERLEAILNQMDRKIRIVEQDQKSSIWSFLRYNGDTAYNSLFYEFEMSKKIPLAFGMLTDKQLNAIINTPVASRKLSTRLSGNAAKMKKNLNRVLMSGFGKGLSTQKMARQIADIGGAEYRRAMNIARTEAGRVTGVTRQQSQNRAKELGVDVKKKWVSTLDGDTRTNHRELDGQVKEIEEHFSVGGHSALQPHMFGIASEDCNCRCATISVIEGYEPSLRRDNESHEEIDYQNYNDWLGSKSENRSNSSLANEIAEEILNNDSILSRLNTENDITDLLGRTKTDLDELRDNINSNVRAFEEENINLNRQLEDGLISYDEYEKSLKNLSTKHDDSDLRARHKALLDLFQRKQWELVQIQQNNALENAQNIKDTLSKYRKMGVGELNLKDHLSSVRSRVGKTVVDAYDVMPTDWVKNSVDYGKINLKNVKRGYYSHGSPATLALSERRGASNSFRTAIHELTHRQEYVNNAILEAEKEFYKLRTGSENSVRLKNVFPNSNYGREEITRVDNFLNAYMGKDYGGRAYELLSMGLDTLYTRPLDLAKDREMFEWVIHMLLSF